MFYICKHLLWKGDEKNVKMDRGGWMECEDSQYVTSLFSQTLCNSWLCLTAEYNVTTETFQKVQYKIPVEQLDSAISIIKL